MSDQRVYSPKEFFERLVKPTYEDYLADPLAHHRVKNAISQMDIMAERMWRWWSQYQPSRIHNTQTAREYREYLAANECPDFQLVWDIHDSHKHVELGRANRAVTSAGQSGIQVKGRAFQKNAFQANAFQVGTEKFIVRLDNGQERDVSDILGNVEAMWLRLI